MLKVKGYKGITLIALVITIIVLLILAGVAIVSLSGDNSAPQKAREASEKNAISNELEAIKMAVVKSVTAGETGLVNVETLKNELNALVEEGRLEIRSDNAPWRVVGKKSKALYEIDLKGQVIVKSGITLTPSEIILSDKNATTILTATLSEDLTGTIKWSIPENNGVASISATEGNSITVTKTGNSGETTITATLSGTSYFATCKVEIYTPAQVGDNIVLGNAISGVGNKTGAQANEDDWVILYDGREATDDEIKGVFCILADYLPNDNSVISLAGLEAISNRIYNVCSTTHMGPGLITSLKDENQTAWKTLVSSTILGNYYSQTKAYGALTYSTMNKILKATKASRYYKASSATNYETHNCYGYWIAQVGSYSTDVKLVYYNGQIYDERSFNDFSFSMNGVCPVVVLPSNVSLTKINGIWHVNTNN